MTAERDCRIISGERAKARADLQGAPERGANPRENRVAVRAIALIQLGCRHA